MQFSRSSGILLHITSLPSQYGIGDLGPESFRFVDFLQKSGQSIWQLLPLGPPAFGDSPYSSYSAFAGNPMLISLEGLVDTGLLDASDLTDAQREPTDAVDFGTVRSTKLPLLEKAFQRFQPEASADFEQFCDTNHWWLDDFARFTALSERFGSSNWSNWDADLVARQPSTLSKWDTELEAETRFAKFLQFTFFSQWQKLKAYANEHSVKIFGDMPIFVAYESADVWANQELFFLDEEGKQTVVAGVPPDYFSETGQRWGNPLYRWDKLAESGYDWWIKRFQIAFETFDLMRIDHFRGFESYWEVQADCPTAIDGQWVPGPGAAPFLAAQAELGELPIVAEDLGLITDEVHDLRDELDFPGMRVFQFGFDNETDPYHRPEAYPEHSAVYTGTHDNETIMGWYQERKTTRTEDPLLEAVIPADSPAPHLAMIRSVFETPASIAITPMQDLLGLGNEARMNTPGEASGNWGWRCRPEQLSDDVASQLLSIAESTSRVANVAAATS